MSRVAIVCPLCGPSLSKTWTREAAWTVVRCLRCDLLQTWPQPGSTVTDAIYATGAYYESREMGAQAQEASKERARSILSALRSPPSSILDVGAGQGHLVHAFRALDFSAEGAEPSPAGRNAASQLYGIRLSGEIPRTGAFALVTLIHSLEHTRDPIALLEQLHPLVTRGGSLFIEVPNAGSVEMWSPRRRRLILDLPAHMFHFVPRTLARVVEKAGFRVTGTFPCNPTLLENMLARRARARPGVRGSSEPRGVPAVPGAVPGTIPAGRRWWRDQALPAVRAIVPGWKFHLLAIKD
jgi:SAM-dependent methyltransferase